MSRHDLADFKTKDGEWGNHSVPSHFISPDGTHYPLSLLSIDPAMFGRVIITCYSFMSHSAPYPGNRHGCGVRFTHELEDCNVYMARYEPVSVGQI